MKDSFGHGSNSISGGIGVSHQAGVESALGVAQPYGVVSKDQPQSVGDTTPAGVTAQDGLKSSPGYSTDDEGVTTSDSFY
jgi:hypothetical protein